MTVSDVKLTIFRKVDSLNKEQVEELYGIVLNYLNEQKDIEDWNALTEAQRQGILSAAREIDAGKSIPHKEVIANMRKKYAHG